MMEIHSAHGDVNQRFIEACKLAAAVAAIHRNWELLIGEGIEDVSADGLNQWVTEYDNELGQAAYWSDVASMPDTPRPYVTGNNEYAQRMEQVARIGIEALGLPVRNDK